MRIKHVAIGLTVFLLCLLPTSTKVHANQPSDFLIRNYSIGLTIDCLGTALEQLNNMQGIILNSHIDIQSGWGSMDRRVTNRDLEMALEHLQSLGQVVYNHSGSQNVFSVISDLRSELNVRNTEYNRLMELLYEVETLSQFTSVENRLVQVIADMEHIRGRLNHLELETGTSRIHITLSVVEVEEALEDPGLFERMMMAFMTSNQAILSVLQGILIFFAYISVPLASYGLVAGVIIWLAVFYKRKRSAAIDQNIEAKKEVKKIESETEAKAKTETADVVEGAEKIGEAKIEEVKNEEPKLRDNTTDETKNDE